MINAILAYIRGMIKHDESVDSLDAYIAANDPKTPEDVERLEREYQALTRYNNFTSERYY